MSKNSAVPAFLGILSGVLLGWGCRDSTSAGPVADPQLSVEGSYVELTANAGIGTGNSVPGEDWQYFIFDVTDAPGGRLDYRDFSVVRSDGSVATLTVDSDKDPATSITSFTRTSDACATFTGTGRLDTGDLLNFSIDACDNGPNGPDSIAIAAPDAGYQRAGRSEGYVTLRTVEPPPGNGDLVVTIATTGGGFPEHFMFEIRSDEMLGAGEEAPNSTLTFTKLVAGDYKLTLVVARNCTVNGDNPRIVTVPADQTTHETFEVYCAPDGKGDLTLRFITTGSDLDPDGYFYRMVQPNGTTLNGHFASNASFTLVHIDPGERVITVRDVADNCTLTGDNPRTATLPANGSLTVTFEVVCSPIPRRVAFIVQPSNTAPLMTIRPPVQVAAVDNAGNPVAAYSGPVTIAIGHNGGVLLPGTLRGTLTVNAVNGYATFPDLSIDRPGTGYTLVGSALALIAGESGSFNILAPLAFP